jgi:dephospho-CoA kinase
VYSIGLTGQIASGKSTVAELFSTLGIEIVGADLIAKELTQSSKPAYHLIKEHFGRTILDEKKEINRAQLRKLIFHDTNARIWLENLLHPLIRNRIEQDLTMISSPYCIIEIPLLRDRKNFSFLDRILFIESSQALKTLRVSKRDQCSEKTALTILATQGDINCQNIMPDDTIVNNESIEQLQDEVIRLHQLYLQLAAQSS